MPIEQLSDSELIAAYDNQSKLHQEALDQWQKDLDQILDKWVELETEMLRRNLITQDELDA